MPTARAAAPADFDPLGIFSGDGRDQAPLGDWPDAGSNVDLGVEVHQIKAELRSRAAALDVAYQAVLDADGALPDLRATLREVRDQAWKDLDKPASILARHGVTVARARVEFMCREPLRAVEEAEALRERGAAMQRKLETQISAAQTLARLWLAQHDEAMGRRGMR